MHMRTDTLLIFCLVGVWAFTTNDGVFIDSIAVDESVGFQPVISQRGMDYFRGIGMQVVSRLLINTNISPLSGTYGAPILGDISWNLDNIKLASIDLGTSSSSTTPNEGITIQMNNVAGVVNSNWRYRENDWPHISASGSAVTKMTATATVLFSIGVDNGAPQITVKTSQVTIQTLDIQIDDGSVSWLYNLFATVLHNRIKDAISDALSNAIKVNLQDALNQSLRTIVLTQKIADGLVFDAKFLPSPIYGTNYVAILESGRTYQENSPDKLCPSDYCPTRNLPSTPSNTSRMFNIYVSDYVANSLMYAAHHAGILSYEVHQSQVPSNSPVQMNTSSFALWVPVLDKLYPNTAMSVKAYTSIPPTAHFLPAGAEIKVKGLAEFWVHPSNGSAAQMVFVLTGNGTVQATAGLRGWNLIAELGRPDFNFQLQKSYIGDFDPQQLRVAIQFFVVIGVIPAINAQLGKGIALPSVSGCSFITPTLKMNDNYLTIDTDVNLSL